MAIPRLKRERSSFLLKRTVAKRRIIDVAALSNATASNSTIYNQNKIESGGQKKAKRAATLAEGASAADPLTGVGATGAFVGAPVGVAEAIATPVWRF